MEYYAKSKKVQFTSERINEIKKNMKNIEECLKENLTETDIEILNSSITDIAEKTEEKQKTLKEHHKDIVTCAEMFFLEYGEYFTEKEKKLVVEACRIHDLGKVNLVFQAMICPKLAEKFYIDVRKTQQIPHGFLSAVTISLDEFDDLSELFSDKDFGPFITAVYYHHDREDHYNSPAIRKYAEKYYMKQIEEYLNRKIRKLNCSNLDDLLFRNNVYTGKYIPDSNAWKEYLLIKGLLNKFDYTVSAGYENAESAIDLHEKKLVKNIEKFLNGKELRPAQKFMKMNRDKNLIVIAPTGSGKTEASLLWMNGEKSFYTLPLKVSSNAIYLRIKENYEYKDVALLHSDAMAVYLREYNGNEDIGEKYERSKMLSQPLTVCTVDQLFRFVYRALGTEIFAATLKYSKLVLDEIQAYEPRVIATIIYGLKMIQESLEEMNEMLRKSQKRLQHWVVESHDTKQLITSLGTVTFKKTLFTNKETGESEYLLDRIVGLEKHERITEDALARMLNEAVQTSYRRGGEETSLTTDVEKQTVKNKIHALEFPKNTEKPENKKEIEYLYIEADEDHVSLQFRDKKGDLEENENHRKNNCLITKLVYVHEGIEKESPKSERHRLINPYYFCGTSYGEENTAFWDEVYEYINNHYDLDKVKKIYMNADGGAWIKSGMRRIAGITYVLDEFHIEKYLTKLTSHMKDSREDAADELRAAIRSKTKKDFEEIIDRLEGCLENETGQKRISDAKEYILSNWMAAKLRLRHQDGVKGSSTEGHVSHVLSSRMSSRPMGWSITGATKMAKLRAYDLNGGDMLELVRYQKRNLAKAVGASYNVLSSTEIIQSEKNRHGKLGKYVESISHSMSLQNKKIVYFNSHIWGL